MGAESTPEHDDVRRQLDRVLASGDFASAERASRFLRFLVEETLEGRSEQLKEYTLARMVFDRDESFDPSANPAVRVEASRLRRRLEHYYLTQGREDPVLIEVRRGSYVPVFRTNRDVLHSDDELQALTDSDIAGFKLQELKGPVIAVLPFDNLGDEEDQVFSDGITVEIMTALSRFREFHVLGRFTTFSHRDDEDARRVGEKLGATYVLEGSVRRSDERIRINAELASTADGKIMWSQGYERDLSTSTIFDIQDDISNHVVAMIAQPHGAIARPELAVTKRKPPESLDTYDCILLFYDYSANLNPDSHGRVCKALEAAVERDPDCSNVWAALSQVHLDSYRFGFNMGGNGAGKRREYLEKAAHEAQHAVRLDPENPVAYHSLFLVRFQERNLKAFREAGDRALSLNSNNSDILADYGVHLMLGDNAARGRLFLKAAMVLNPEPPDWYFAPFFSQHFHRGEYEEALDMALRARNMGFYWTHCMHALAYQALGMHEEARASIERLLAIYPDFPDKVHEELRRWTDAERMQRALQVLRAAGLPDGEAEAEASGDA